MSIRPALCRGKGLPNESAGFTLLEVLITLVVITFGLLGLAAMQGRALLAESEAYQRAQAVSFLDDMVDRINANRQTAATFVGDYGTDASVPASIDANSEETIQGWNNLLLGVNETIGSGSDSVNAGGALNARGCVVREGTDTNLYYVAVAWQGLAETVAPAAPTGAPADLVNAVACGQGSYGDSDALRRVVWTSIRIANLRD